MAELVVTGVRTLDDDVVDVHLSDGLIQHVLPAGSFVPSAADTVDGRGSVVLPGMVESHLHLDKAHLGPVNGGLAEAIAATATRKASFTHDDVRGRATRVVHDAVASGTTAIRAHTEIDPTVGLIGVEAIDGLRHELSHLMRIQLAAFPQEGLESRPGTLPLLRDALTLPDTVVGGCPYVEHDLAAAQRHVDTVLDLAVEHAVPADLHLDLADTTTDPRFTLAVYVAGGVIARGLQGRVAIGHATSLSALAPSDRARTLEALADADVTVTVLPATDLFLNGRGLNPAPQRGLAPLTELWAAGVPTAVSSNNIRNAFTPSGRADLLDICLLLARVMHVGDPAGLRRILDMATTSAARVLDPGRPVGLVEGAAADLVLMWDTTPAGIINDQPAARTVIRDGTIVARSTIHHWTAASPAHTTTSR